MTAYKATRCDDGKWMVHTHGDVIAYAAQGDEEAKARRMAAALNAATTFIPKNEHGVKPGFYTRRDIAALLQQHGLYHDVHEAVLFIAKCME